MGTSSYYKEPTTSVARRAPTTYEEDQEQRAADQYNQFGRRVLEDTEASRTRRTQAGTAADRAYGDFMTPRRSALSTYTPTALQQYEPMQVSQWLSSFTTSPKAPGGGAGRASASARMASSADGAQDVDFESENLAGFDPSALTNFDPAAAGKEFAAGAYGDFRRNLSDELEGLENASIGAGRFRTGLFDEDQGRVVNRLGADFNDRIAQESTNLAGLRLSALQGGTELGFRRASDMDANRRAIAELNAQLGFNREELSSRESMAAADRDLGYDRLALDAFNSDTDRERLALGAAEGVDERALRRATDLSRIGYDQAADADRLGLERERTGLDAAISRERGAASDYFAGVDRSSDYLSGSRDYARQDRELAELRKLVEELRRNSGALPPGIGSSAPDPYAAQKKLAAQLGVPFKATY